jgi:polyisoprenyl-teichoic acid--peptidoglycan teichoic acid transferase
MTKQRPTLDGFVPRRPGSQLGDQHSSTNNLKAPQAPPNGLRRSDPTDQTTPLRRVAAPSSIRNEIDESLRGINASDELPRDKKGRRKKGPKSKTRRIIKWSIIALLIILVGIGAWVAYKALTASGNVFKGNIFDIVQNQPLKQDANGRSNILIFGTSEDDPGHGGADLTDSIMVVSVDQNKKNAYMVSIPRDLYVEYGAMCPEGYRGKINSMYSCFSEGDVAKEEAGADALRTKVGEVLGLDIQYYTHLNYTAVKQAVDAVGGVDITIESEDPKGILDRNFDWKCNYKCYYVNYKNGEVAHMDGEHALAFSRARNASGGYGLPNGNFDREKNQQKVIKALREKAVSAGTLTNVGKVTGLIDALGNNLRTNFETKEIRTLMKLGSDIKSDAIQPVSLVEEGNMLVTTGNIGGASIVQPVAGVYNYADIHSYVNKKLNANEITREAANVVVLNGSGVAGVAQREADELEAKGFVISGIDTAPDGEYGDIDVYQIGEGKKATKSKLESLFKVKVKTSTPPVQVTEGTNFVVIFGKDRSAKSQ